jgi:hypothetical protein
VNIAENAPVMNAAGSENARVVTAECVLDVRYIHVAITVVHAPIVPINVIAVDQRAVNTVH